MKTRKWQQQKRVGAAIRLVWRRPEWREGSCASASASASALGLLGKEDGTVNGPLRNWKD